MDFGRKWQLMHERVTPNRFYWWVMPSGFADFGQVMKGRRTSNMKGLAALSEHKVCLWFWSPSALYAQSIVCILQFYSWMSPCLYLFLVWWQWCFVETSIGLLVTANLLLTYVQWHRETAQCSSDKTMVIRPIFQPFQELHYPQNSLCAEPATLTSLFMQPLGERKIQTLLWITLWGASFFLLTGESPGSASSC